MISHYQLLSDKADLRAAKAQSRVGRRRLDEQRADWLQSRSAATEVCLTESDTELKPGSDDVLPRSTAAAAVNDELAASDADDRQHRASNGHSQTSLPGWATRGLVDRSVPRDTLRSETSISDDRTGKILVDNNLSQKLGTRARWGSVEPLTVAVSESCESLKVDDHSSMQLVTSLSGSLISLPKDSVKSVEQTSSVKKRRSSAASACSDGVFEGELSSDMSVSETFPCRDEQLQVLAAHQSVSQESTESQEQRHVRSVDSQHISKETVATDVRRHIKPVPDQSVCSETTQVEDRPHPRVSSWLGATTESEEMQELVSVESAETDEDAMKPSIRVHSERHATNQTESSVLVSFISAHIYWFDS